MELKEINTIQPIYFIPHDNFVSEVLIPCLKNAESFNCMLGFFSSASFREIAPGLAEFINVSKNKMRLLISPYISSEDQKALNEGITTPPEILEKRLFELFGNSYISESALVRHTLDCLAYLIAVSKLEIKIIYLSNALFHPKIWIFSDSHNSIVAHGSVNMTQRALTVNYEHITMELSWIDSGQSIKVSRFLNEFNSMWLGKRNDAIIMDLPEAIRKKLLTEYQPDSPPTPKDFLNALELDNKDNIIMLSPEKIDKLNISNEIFNYHIPDWLRYKEGPFLHQGKAVDAWINANYNGVLEMATGSGKTITAMIAANLLYKKQSKLLIIISVPYLPLVNQWEEETKRFDLKTIIPSKENNRKAKFKRIENTIRALKLKMTDVQCLIITHDLLCDIEFHKLMENLPFEILLIADEVHNLGRNEFIKNPPKFPQYRLGLSATPVRQYDETGTEDLFKYFGEVVFRFGLEEAIGNCLVPYEYYIHRINMTNEELNEWLRLTEMLQRNSWNNSGNGNEIPSEYVNSLLRRRKLILEKASAKIHVLSQLLKRINPKDYRHTLIYATDKNPEQLHQVNQILRKMGIRFHQITAEETKNQELVKQIFLRFQTGELQVLTAKRVLDEGVNIPEVTTAFILASTSVERQWIQRRGRLLRQCLAINKKYSVIHDFIVLPPENDLSADYYIRKLIKSELRRVLEFAKLSKNAASPDGALSVITPIYSRYFAGERN